MEKSTSRDIFQPGWSLSATYKISVRVNEAVYRAPSPSPPFCLGFDLVSSLFKVLGLSLSTLPVLAGAFLCRSCASRALMEAAWHRQWQQGCANVRATHCMVQLRGPCSSTQKQAFHQSHLLGFTISSFCVTPLLPLPLFPGFSCCDLPLTLQSASDILL